MSKVTKQCDEQIKALFGDKVDFNYITDMTSHIMHSKEYKKLVKSGVFPISYKLTTHKYSYKKVVMYSVGVNFFYDSLTLNDGEEKITARYEDEEYKKELINKVLDQLKYVSLLWPTELEMPATYYPIMTAMCSLRNAMSVILEEYIKSHSNYREIRIEDFKVTSFKQILNTINSILTQTSIGDYSGARTSIRVLIEDYFIYIVLHDKKYAIKEYIKFIDAQKEFETKGKFNEKFLNTVPEGVDPIKYVDYGWLRALDRRNNRRVLYKFRDLAYHSNDENKDDWITTYNHFSKHSHGEVLEFHKPVVETLEIASYVASLLYRLADVFEKDFQVKVEYYGADLVNYLYGKIQDLHVVLDTAKIFHSDK